MIDRRAARWLVLLCLLTSVGCAAPVPYRYGRFRHQALSGEPLELGGPAVEYGQPMPALDRLASVVSLPEKVLGLNRRIGNHDVSLDTVARLRNYLERNDLADVTVYVNCYDPAEQWRRLAKNRRVGFGWRYTMGALSLVSYTLLPGRVFGGDYYNPYNNTLNINSDVPALVIYEAAMAKKVHGHYFSGTYATLSDLPGFALARRTWALGDVLGYAQAEHDQVIERQVYEVLYSQVGAETASAAVLVLPAWWAVPALSAGGAAMGHVTGRWLEARHGDSTEAAAGQIEHLPPDPQPPSSPADAPAADGVAMAETAEGP